MLSVSATFAADEDTTLAAGSDEITIHDDVLSVEENTDTLNVADEEELETDDTSKVVSTSATVTNSTFHNYFDENGTVTSDADELIFEGDFTGIEVNAIKINKSIKLTANNAIFNGVKFDISANNVVIDGFKLYMNNKDTSVINIGETVNVTVSNNEIEYTALDDTNSFAISANLADNLRLLNNVITYVGTTNGSSLNYVISISGCESPIVKGNKINSTMPTATMGGDTATQGIVFVNSKNIDLTGNTVNFKYAGDEYGSYPTTNFINVGYGCDDAVIKDNIIAGNGGKFTYGIFIQGSNFTIENNNFDVVSDVYYACGISINPGVVKGIVKDNIINVKAKSAGYGIYSFGYSTQYGDVYSKDIVYESNNISVDSYLACGMELCENNSVVTGNQIYVTGNLTCGIYDDVSNNGIASISDNTVEIIASENHLAETGDNYLKNTTTSMGIDVLGNAIIKNNKVTSSAIGINLQDKGNILLDNNELIVIALNETVKNHALNVASIDTLNVTNNKITFNGKSNGTTDSNAISVTGVDDVQILNNTIDATLTAGQGSAITISNCPNPEISKNTVDFSVEGFVNWGSNDVVFVNFGCDNAKIINNNILAEGSYYIYGVKIYAQNFTIENNDLTIISDVNYACGINPDAGATGVVNKNNISVAGVGTVYGIYSGMWSAENPLTVNYTNNVIDGNGFFACGIELGGAKENVVANTITLEGNYTIGVALYKYAQNTIESTISGNTIVSNGESIGNASAYYDSVGIETAGIKIASGNVTITDNDVRTAGDYAINLCGSNATVADNYLAGKKGVGANSVANAENATISGSGPDLKTILSAVDLYTTYLSGDVYYVKALDENGDPIKNATVYLTVDGKVINETTDNYGVASFLIDEWDVGEYLVTVSYKGNETYGPKSMTGFISVDKRVSAIAAPASVNVLVTAIKNGYNYKFTLTDDRGNGLENEKVTITFNGKTETVSTDALGVVNYKLVATKVGTQKVTITFDSNKNYVESTATATVKITKEATKLTAAKKTFKSKVKTKKYTVTLKDSKGKAIKKVKLTLKIKGKKYTAKTNAKGKATFKIKKLTKKGKYTAKITFAGNNLYNKAAKSVKITVKK